jgi:hypothetical protein
LLLFCSSSSELNSDLFFWILPIYLSNCLLLGNLGKTYHPRNVKFDKIHEISFQGGWIYEDPESWTCKAPKSQTCEDLESRTCKAPKSRTCEDLESWTCEAPKSRTWEALESWTRDAPEVANLWRHGVMNLRNHEVGNLWNSGIYWSLNLEVVAHGDFLNKEIHGSVGSQVKDVASKVRVWRVN